MAAGRGIRMKPLTDKIPKAMAPISGSTLISEGIKQIKKNIENVHITVGYKGAMLAKHVIQKDVSSVINTEGKGNSWWIYNSVIKNIKEPIFVLTCDNVYEFDYMKYCNEYYKLGSPLCMIIPAKFSNKFAGDKININKEYMITKIDRNINSKIICSGVQIINPLKINQKTNKTENFNEVWKQLIKLKSIFCSKYPIKNWYAVDNINQLLNLNLKK